MPVQPRDSKTILDAKEYWIETRKNALLDAIRDVCAKCGQRARPGGFPDGPNAAGNYSHGSSLCPASPIWSRMVFEKLATIE